MAFARGKVKIRWSSNFAYAIGLIASDGCLSNDGRHIIFVSKDLEQIKNFMLCLKIKVHVGKTLSGYSGKSAYRIQFSDALFYRFLEGIGLTKAKSLKIKKVDIPDEYFFDFLRGYFDGDGYSYSYWDKRWRSSFIFYIGFVSASKEYVDWLRTVVWLNSGLTGHVTKWKNKNMIYHLKYAKKEAVKLFHLMNSKNKGVRLTRKYLKIKDSLHIMGKQSGQ